MARKILQVNKANRMSEAADLRQVDTMFETPDAVDGAEFELGKDHKTLILLKNDSGSNVQNIVIQAGNGIQGVADLLVELHPVSFTFVCPEAGRFKVMTGKDRGKVLIFGDAKVAVFELP